ncbi:MAG: hypothetical protein PVSMB11_00800 [Desulfuromonadaceae bacterium]
MNNKADHEIRYYPKESLCLTDDVPGANRCLVASHGQICTGKQIALEKLIDKDILKEAIQ